MSPKELFLKNRTRADQVRAVTQELWFQEALSAVRAQIMSTSGLSADAVKGAILYESTLLDLCVEIPENEPIGPGMRHDLDNRAPTREKDPQPKQ